MEEKELKIIIEFMDAIFFSKDTYSLLLAGVEFFVSKFKLSNASITVFDKRIINYSNEKNKKAYEKAEGMMSNELRNNRVPVYFYPKKDFFGKIECLELLPESCLALPLVQDRDFTGMICLYSDNDIKYIKDILQAVAEKLIRALAVVSNYDKLKVSATTDALTGLYNRTFFDDVFPKELGLCSEKKLPCSLIMLDIDNFKIFNDTRGHLEGDRILKQAASLVKTAIRSSDSACRFGGEEFVALLPNAKHEDAKEIAEKIRKLVEQNCDTTVSLGLATCLNSSVSPHDFIKEADKALYKAKNGGKNKVASSLILDKCLGTIDVDDASDMGKLNY